MLNNKKTLKVNTSIERVKKSDTLSPTTYSPASIVENVNKIIDNSKKKHIWKKSKLTKSIKSIK